MMVLNIKLCFSFVLLGSDGARDVFSSQYRLLIILLQHSPWAEFPGRAVFGPSRTMLTGLY